MLTTARRPALIIAAHDGMPNLTVAHYPSSVTEGWRGQPVARKWILPALAAAVLVGACDTSVPPSATPIGNVAQATISPSVAASQSASASPSPTLSPTATATATPSATPTPSPTPAPTPAPWKTYKSKRFHYRIKYPPEWVVTPGSNKLADQIDDFGDHVIYVSRDVVTGGTLSISLTVSHDIGTYKSHYKAKLLSNTSISLQGYSGKMLVFSGRDNGLNVLIQHIIIGKGNTAYFLTMFSGRSQIKADKALFKKIYRTWKPT